MNIIRITSGLGNQLFQYSFGRALSLSNNIDVKFDIKIFEEKKFRKLGLNHFNTIESWASDSEISELKKKAYNPVYFFRNFNLISNYGVEQKGKKYFIQKPRTTDNKDLIRNNYFINSYFQGFFLNQVYFQDIRNTLLSEITLKNNPTEYFESILKMISDSNSVSIHVRRGDYLSHDLLNVMPISYYKSAIEYISSHQSNIKFFVFTDDKSWVKENFTFLGDAVYVDTFDYEELILMSKCKHNIIANSTFGWWGAWLNNYHQKLVVAPQTWYKDKLSQNWYENSTYIPSEWKKI